MKVAYRRELEHNYLVLKQEKYLESYQVGMILKNKIPGFLECKMSCLNEGADLYYEITSKQSLRLVLERKKISQTELLKLLEGLCQVVRSCKEYLLDVGYILLLPDYIYLDPDEWEPFFCFFPFERQEPGGELLELAEYLLDCLDRQDSGAVTLGYEFYRLAGEENPSLVKLLDIWKTENTDAAYETYREIEQGQKMEGKKIVQYDKNGEKTVLEDACIREGDEREKTGTVFPEWSEEGEGGTSFLSKLREPGLFLRSESAAYPDLRITKDNFLIGKKKDAVDGWLKARGISRIHGRVTKEEDSYYLTDLNSTNGTFLNGGRLGVNEKARLRPGDSVGFADVRYVVEG